MQLSSHSQAKAIWDCLAPGLLRRHVVWGVYDAGGCLELRDGGGPPLRFSRPRLHESGLFTPYVRGDQLSRRGRSNAGGDSRRTATGTPRSCSAAHSTRSERRLRGRGVNKTTGGVVCSQPCGTRGDADFAHTGMGPTNYHGGGGGGGG